MGAPESALVAYWSEHRAQLRQSESQRAVLTNYVLAIAAALSGLVVQQRFRLADVAVVGPGGADRLVRGAGGREIPRTG